ncbi:MAG TPA: hypothetical protein VNO33_02190 [Kofleriaceae bacterium]|nr:hypothetical protein [Kofleriaceae bacterium]
MDLVVEGALDVSATVVGYVGDDEVDDSGGAQVHGAVDDHDHGHVEAMAQLAASASHRLFGEKLDHWCAMQRPCRHTGTGSAAFEQLCGAHRTALQVAPNEAWSTSTRLREATRFWHVGKQQSDSEVTAASGRAVAMQSTSAVHSLPGWSDDALGSGDGAGAGSGAGVWLAGAGLGAETTGPLAVVGSPHAIASGRVRRRHEIRIARVTLASMPADSGSSSPSVTHRRNRRDIAALRA